MNAASLKISLLFWLHLLAVIATWTFPFLLNWKLAIGIYAAIMIQFAVFGKCLMSEHHGSRETGDRIFYTELVEYLGFRPDPRMLKLFIRRFLYPILSSVALIWQAWLGNEPLLF